MVIEAMRLAAKLIPEIAVLDLLMPLLNGLEATGKSSCFGLYPEKFGWSGPDSRPRNKL
jgi:hypothetical protein